MNGLFGCVVASTVLFIVLVLPILMSMIFIVEPRQSHMLLYWGKFSRSVSEPGIHFAFPIGLRRIPISTRDATFSLPVTTMVEASGNPIQVSCVVVYRVVDAERAVLGVQGYERFVQNQTSAVLKSVCSRFPYEARRPGEPNLKHESDEVLEALRNELNHHVQGAGMEVRLVRLNDLTYAPEIAQSMLLRQQALALVDARRTLVEGALATVQDGLHRLKIGGIQLDPSLQLQLASNLTLLLCAGERGEQHSTVVTRSRS